MEYVMKVKKRNFEALMNGDLTFVIHKVDRLYSAGDRLVLFEPIRQGNTPGANHRRVLRHTPEEKRGK